jgi:hypothetical protein
VRVWLGRWELESASRDPSNPLKDGLRVEIEAMVDGFRRKQLLGLGQRLVGWTVWLEWVLFGRGVGVFDVVTRLVRMVCESVV